MRLQDKHIWGLSKNSLYSSQSGYIFLISLPDFQTIHSSPLPPIEKRLWSNIWKIKNMPKIRHFFWKSLSGALSVATRLQSRGLNVDPICHILFHCSTAKEVWERSAIPLPCSGFSMNSVFLNIHHLLVCSKNSHIAKNLRFSIPWLLWLIWKARNS